MIRPWKYYAVDTVRNVWTVLARSEPVNDHEQRNSWTWAYNRICYEQEVLLKLPHIKVNKIRNLSTSSSLWDDLTVPETLVTLPVIAQPYSLQNYIQTGPPVESWQLEIEIVHMLDYKRCVSILIVVNSRMEMGIEGHDFYDSSTTCWPTPWRSSACKFWRIC
jgi:hypothetical protein